MLEPSLARLAAERRTEENLEELKRLHADLIASIDNFREFSLINVKWHNAVAKASGNELLATVLYSISHGVLIATTAEEYDTSETRKQVIAIHSRVNDAIESRDPDAAERRMRRHIATTHARPLAIAATSIALAEEMPRAAVKPPAKPRRRTKNARGN